MKRTVLPVYGIHPLLATTTISPAAQPIQKKIRNNETNAASFCPTHFFFEQIQNTNPFCFNLMSTSLTTIGDVDDV